MSGWFAVTRKIFNHGLFGGESYTKREAWLYLISVADYEGESRGCFSITERELARIWHWDRSKVQRFLDCLIREEMLEPTINPRMRQDRAKYRVKNYETYQTVNSSDNPSVTRNQSKNRSKDQSIYNKDQQDLTNNKTNNTPLPPELDVPEFHAAFAEWETHKRQRRESLTPLSVKKLLNKLEAIGVERAIAAIDYSIGKGWAGVYEEKTGVGVGSAPLTSAAIAHMESQEILRRMNK